MKCQDCELLLEEYFDGEADERTSGAIAAHLKTCAACAETYDGLAAEQSLYAAYEREVEVTPALWAGVEARLRAEQREGAGKTNFVERLRALVARLLVAPRFSPALTAALVVAAVVATAVVMRSFGGGDAAQTQVAQSGDQKSAAPTAASPNANASESPTATRQPSPAAAPSATPQPSPQPKLVPSRPDPNKFEAAVKRPKQGVSIDKKPAGSRPPLGETAAADRLVREAEQRYVAAIRILERDVRKRRDGIDPQTRARFDETLASIDRTIAETRKSARQHGNDPVAVQYMLSAYAKKVEVMREMAALGGQ